MGAITIFQHGSGAQVGVGGARRDVLGAALSLTPPPKKKLESERLGTEDHPSGKATTSSSIFG